MYYNTNITKHKCLEVILLERAWNCIFDIGIELTYGNKHDYAGLYSYFIIFGFKIIEFNLYNVNYSGEK